jgi:hypothetical protein
MGCIYERARQKRYNRRIIMMSRGMEPKYLDLPVTTIRASSA